MDRQRKIGELRAFLADERRQEAGEDREAEPFRGRHAERPHRQVRVEAARVQEADQRFDCSETREQVKGDDRLLARFFETKGSSNIRRVRLPTPA